MNMMKRSVKLDIVSKGNSDPEYAMKVHSLIGVIPAGNQSKTAIMRRLTNTKPIIKGEIKGLSIPVPKNGLNGLL